MNKFILAGLAGVAVCMLPAVAIAQDNGTNSGILVTGKYQKDWEKGSQLEANGLRDLESAQRDLSRASADVVGARDRLNSSQERGNNAQTEFRRLTARPAAFSDSGEASKWAKQVAEAARDWDRYGGRASDGEETLDDAGKKQRKAQQAVDKAQQKIARGRAMMAEAQQRSAGTSQ